MYKLPLADTDSKGPLAAVSKGEASISEENRVYIGEYGILIACSMTVVNSAAMLHCVHCQYKGTNLEISQVNPKKY